MNLTPTNLQDHISNLNILSDHMPPELQAGIDQIIASERIALFSEPFVKIEEKLKSKGYVINSPSDILIAINFLLNHPTVMHSDYKDRALIGIMHVLGIETTEDDEKLVANLAEINKKTEVMIRQIVTAYMQRKINEMEE